MGVEGKDKNLSVEEYLDKIKPYLSDIINNHKTQGTWRIHYPGNKIIEHKTESEWKIHLTMKINFASSLPDSAETCIMHARSDNIQIMMGSETEEVMKELFESLLKRYQKKKLEESMDGSHFAFDGVNALYYDLNKVRLSRGRSYIDSPGWLKNKKATICQKNNGDNCFRYPLTVALNREQIKSRPERISNIKPFID